MTTKEILDKVLNEFKTIPTDGTYSEIMKAQSKAFDSAEHIIKQQLQTAYNNGYEAGIKFHKDQLLKNQIKNN
ncbi:MAG: hypothetical protein E2590_12655 [Chryseobacterium sp.]|nr:hypothetical protein [Chryseobacterium sp.]